MKTIEGLRADAKFYAELLHAGEGDPEDIVLGRRGREELEAILWCFLAITARAPDVESFPE